MVTKNVIYFILKGEFNLIMSEIIKLRTGIMSTEEIAKWFGVSYGHFRKKHIKDKKLKELSIYCDYEVRPHKGFYIKKIYNIDIYLFLPFIEERMKYATERLNNWLPEKVIDSYKAISRYSLDKSDTMPAVNYIDIDTGVVYDLKTTQQKTISSFARIVAKASEEDYGKPSKGINGGGKKGWCEIIDCRAHSDGISTFDYDFIDDEDREEVSKCWDNLAKAKKTKEMLKELHDAIDDEAQLTTDDLIDLVKDWDDSLYVRFIYNPMKDYFAKKYPGEEWIYARATLRHDWEEESAF